MKREKVHNLRCMREKKCIAPTRAAGATEEIKEISSFLFCCYEMRFMNSKLVVMSVKTTARLYLDLFGWLYSNDWY